MNLIDIKHATKTPVITCNGKIINPEDFVLQDMKANENCGGPISSITVIGQTKIPKIIHQIWIGDKEKRPWQLMRSWWLKNKGWRYMLWTEENLFPLINQKHYDAFGNKYAGKSDLMRYEILHRFGGIYIDADTECLRPLTDDLLDNDSFAVWESNYVPMVKNLITGCLLAACPRNKLMELIINDLNKNSVNYTDETWKTVGPLYLTQAIHKFNYFNTIKIYHSDLFIPEHWSEIERGVRHQPIIAPYARHVWSSTHDNNRWASEDFYATKKLEDIAKDEAERKACLGDLDGVGIFETSKLKKLTCLDLCITFKCNGKCPQCNEYLFLDLYKNTNTDMSLDQINKFIEQVKHAHSVLQAKPLIDKLSVFGGEIRLHPQYVEIITRLYQELLCNQLIKELHIFTNASNLNEIDSRILLPNIIFHFSPLSQKRHYCVLNAPIDSNGYVKGKCHNSDWANRRHGFNLNVFGYFPCGCNIGGAIVVLHQLYKKYPTIIKKTFLECLSGWDEFQDVLCPLCTCSGKQLNYDSCAISASNLSAIKNYQTPPQTIF